MAIEFSTASADDVFPTIRDLRVRSFPELVGTEAESEEFFRWKFADRGSRIFLAHAEGGRVAGFYAALPLRYLAEGQEVDVALVVDVMTDPDIRRRGVFTGLGRYAIEELTKEGFAFTTGYPIRPDVMPGHLKVGWRVNVELPLYASPVRVKLASPFARALTRTLSVSPARDDGGLALLTTEELLAEPGYAAFLERWRAGRKFALAEGPEFYRWRYAAPGRTFRHLVGRVDDGLGLVVSTRAAPLRGMPTLAVSDVQALPEALPLLRPVWQALWRLAWREDQRVVAGMAPRALARAARFRSLPFVRSHLKFRLITRDLAGRAPDLAHDPTLKLMWTDTDDV